VRFYGAAAEGDRRGQPGTGSHQTTCGPTVRAWTTAAATPASFITPVRDI